MSIRAELVSLLVIFLTSGGVKTETWEEEQLNVHTRIVHYSGHVDTSGASNALNTRHLQKCISDCFVSANSSFYFRESAQTCYCYTDRLVLDINTVTDDTAPIYGFYMHGYQMFESWSFKKWEMISSKPIDCLSLFESGFVEDGVYLIHPFHNTGVEVWCDMTNGGWTVIQRRLDGSVDFYRPWNDYVIGFGNVTGELWLGLENIHTLTQNPSSLYINMESFGDVTPSTAYAYYSSFSLEGVSKNYALQVDGFSGDCGDSLYVHDGNPFTTKDRDNDDPNGDKCAVTYEGAWWYTTCHQSNLNGL